MDGITSLLHSMTNGAASGTGILKLLPMAQDMFGGTVPDYLVKYSLSQQIAIFGDYPTSDDIAPSAIFTAIFAIFFIAHSYVFLKNMSRGHKFWLSIGFAFYTLMRVVGFAMRISWADDIQRLRVGMASEVFIIVPIVLLASFNLVLAQRIFTWRHPHIGSKNWFWACMIIVYTVVTGVVVMAILGALIPYIYFLSEHHYTMCKQVVRAAAVLCVLYSVLAINLVVGAFLIKPTPKSDKIWTYQPWWIESFGLFYYVKKNACQKAEETFALREPSAEDAVRIIPSTIHYHNTLEKVQSVTSKKGTLTHNTSIAIIALTTIILLISSIFRCVSTFIDQTYANQSWIFDKTVMYIMFGALETIINLAYLIGRVDLRFYRPDKLKKGLCGSLHGLNNGQEETLRGSQTNVDEEKALTQHMSGDHSSHSSSVLGV